MATAIFTTMAFALCLIGFGFLITGAIIIRVQAFKQNTSWGLCVLFLPFAGTLFLIKFWDRREWVSKSFFMQVFGTILYLVGALFGGMALSDSEYEVLSSQGLEPARHVVTRQYFPERKRNSARRYRTSQRQVLSQTSLKK